MSSSDFLKTTMGDAHSLPQGEHVQEGLVLLICSFASTDGNKCTGNFHAS